MGETSAIEWTDATVNFWWGCTKVGPGCDHCYAESFDKRVGGAHWGTGAPRRKIKSAVATIHKLDNDYAWWAADASIAGLHPNWRRRVFIQSMSDLYDNEVPLDWFAEAWGKIKVCDRIHIQIVTKRISMVEKRLAAIGETTWPQHAGLIISVVNQAEADRDIPRLLALKAKLGIPWVGLSMEPLLGPVDLGRWMASANVTCKACNKPFWLHDADPCEHGERGAWTLACPNCGNCRCKPAWTPADARTIDMAPPQDWPGRYVGRFDRVHPTIALSAMIDWVIVGGESGPKARPMHPDWARSLRDQCQAAGVPFFFKQWGEWKPLNQTALGEDDAYYHPAPGTNPDASRRCKLDSLCLAPDGTSYPTGLANQYHRIAPGAFCGHGHMSFFRTGKARAGRILDGREWNDMPGALTNA